jgi:hypothetical protein
MKYRDMTADDMYVYWEQVAEQAEGRSVSVYPSYHDPATLGWSDESNQFEADVVNRLVREDEDRRAIEEMLKYEDSLGEVA